MQVLVRPAIPNDIPAVAAIYAHHVATGLASFELQPPSIAEMARRHGELIANGFPYIVAVRAEKVIGYAYAGAGFLGSG